MLPLTVYSAASLPSPYFSCFFTTPAPPESYTLSLHDALPIYHERVAELNLYAARIVEGRRAQFGGHPRMHRILEAHHHERPGCEHVGVGARDRDAACAGQHPAGVERRRALEEVVRRIAVEQRADAGEVAALWIAIADNDKTFIAIRHIEVPVD